MAIGAGTGDHDFYRLDAAAGQVISVITDTAGRRLYPTVGIFDGAGNLLTFNNPIFDGTNSHKVGHDQGDCIRISPKQGTWECRWLTFIAGRGAIMVEGAFFDGRDNTLAITGGTMEFRNARGSMKLMARKGGYDFVFMLLP